MPFSRTSMVARRMPRKGMRSSNQRPRGDRVEAEGQLRLALRPEEGLAADAGLAVEAFGQEGLRRRRPEEQHVLGGPASPRPTRAAPGRRRPLGAARAARRPECKQKRRRGAPPGRHFTFVPGATSASNEHSTALPEIEPGQDHPVRLDAHQLRRLEVRHQDDRLPDERRGLVRTRRSRRPPAATPRRGRPAA